MTDHSIHREAQHAAERGGMIYRRFMVRLGLPRTRLAENLNPVTPTRFTTLSKDISFNSRKERFPITQVSFFRETPPTEIVALTFGLRGALAEMRDPVVTVRFRTMRQH